MHTDLEWEEIDDDGSFVDLQAQDTAQICLNGHVINWASKGEPQQNDKFCSRCGAQALDRCRNCDESIKGATFYWTIEKGMPPGKPNSSNPATIPAYCRNCGLPFPWTETAIEAALELASEVEGISENEREMLKESIGDIARDTPRTSLGATRFKQLMGKVGKSAVDAMREILVDVMSETAKKAIWP